MSIQQVNFTYGLQYPSMAISRWTLMSKITWICMCDLFGIIRHEIAMEKETHHPFMFNFVKDSTV